MYGMFMSFNELYICVSIYILYLDGSTCTSVWLYTPALTLNNDSEGSADLYALRMFKSG